MVDTFGGNTTDFAEVIDPANPGQVKRPPAGQVIRVRDAITQAALPDITTDNYGYWPPFTANFPLIEISGDGGITWKGPLASREALIESLTAGSTATSALQVATAADAKATQALAAVPPDTVVGKGGNISNLPDKLTQFMRVNIPVDSVNTTNNLWPDRFAFWFENTRTGYFNEYGELRSRAAKSNTVAFRCGGFNGGSTGNIFEVTAFQQATVRFSVSETSVVATVPINAPNVSGNKFSTGTTAPPSPVVGDCWVDTSGASNVIKVWTGTVWDA